MKKRKKSPSLGLISNPHQGKERDRDLAKILEKRRVPRLSLSHEQFRLDPRGPAFSVVDLSMEGMALHLLDDDDMAAFGVGTEVRGVLNLRGEKHALEAKVVHVHAGMVGLAFQNLSEACQSGIQSFVDPAQLGKALKLTGSADGALWYEGPSGTHLLLWPAARGFKRAVLYVHGSYVEWDSKEGLSTGKCIHATDKAETQGVVSFENFFVAPDENPDQGKLKVAQVMFKVATLAPKHRAFLSKHLR